MLGRGVKIKTMYSSNRQPIMAFWTLALLAISMLWGASAYAFTPAGTVIKNLATVTYQDSLGNSYTAQSNESSVTVAEVFSARLEKDGQTKDGAPGQIVYFPHQLINDGNTQDRFQLEATNSHDLSEVKVYLDTNGNGQPDDNEPEIKLDEYLKVAAGTTANLVVSARVPGTAQTNDKYTLLMNVAAPNNSSFGGANQATNTNTITVTTGPVIVASKQVVKHIPAEFGSDGNPKANTGSVTYRIKITNNGSLLDEGGIYDFLPHLLDLSSIENPEGQDARLSGFVTNIDKPANIEIPYFPHHAKALYMDLKNLDTGATVAFEFTATYPDKDVDGNSLTFYANALLQNKAFVTFGDKVSETNLVSTTLPQFYGVEAGENKTLPEEPAGGIAEFTNTIVNLGNGADTFNLTFSNHSFPEGTVLSLWDSTGKTPLNDTNGDGTVDTGTLGKDGKITIMVKAQLPVGGKDTPSTVTLTVTSAGDATFSDSVINTLEKITKERIDLANYKVEQDGSDVEINFPAGSEITIEKLFGIDDAHPTTAGAISTISLKPGKVAKFGLYIANESATASSFSLSSEIDKNPGWKVTYIHKGIFENNNTDDGKELIRATDRPITSTPSLPGNSFMKVIAQVEIPADVSNAKAGDYNITFTINSNIHSLSNSTTNKITIKKDLLLEFGPGGANQVEAGGITFYDHVLKNLSNTNLEVRFPAVTPPSGWIYLIYTRDATNELSAAPVSGPMTLTPGETKNIAVKVFAPANAPAGYVFNLTLGAEGKSGETVMEKVFLTNSTTVIKGQVVLTKKVAKKGSSDFQTQLKDVKPGETVIWQVNAVVQGSADAHNVVITDAAPPFTQLTSATSKSAKAGNPTITEGEGVAVVNENNSITFYVGKGATATSGGTLSPGQHVTVTFEVTLDQSNP